MYIYTKATVSLKLPYCFIFRCSTFKSSQLPSYRLVSDAMNHLKYAINHSLKLGMNCSNRLEVEFRLDVIKILFHGKGHTSPSGRGLFYNLEDFDETYFTEEWYIAYD